MDSDVSSCHCNLVLIATKYLEKHLIVIQFYCISDFAHAHISLNCEVNWFALQSVCLVVLDFPGCFRSWKLCFEVKRCFTAPTFGAMYLNVNSFKIVEC